MMKLLKILRQAQDKQNGFTLVELLIVIALIAILSVAVLATINPIEQSNKARDAAFKNDAAEIMNSYERYYASQNNYPWNYGVGTSYEGVSDTTSKVAFHSKDPRFGILDIGDSVATSQLISTSELKSSFGSKLPFKVSAASSDVSGLDAMYVYHSSDSNYVCFCPKAKANRTGEIGKGLKCLKGLSTKGSEVILTDGVGPADLKNADPTGTDTTCTVATPAEILTNEFCDVTKTYGNLMCVPEGSIQ